MKFSILRALVFLLISLPVGFVLTALAFALFDRSIDACGIVPWVAGISLLVGIVAGWQRR